MKQILLFALLMQCLYSHAQNKSIAVVIVPCQSGEIFIDGTSAGTVDANDALNKTLPYGEHYIQLKTGGSKSSQTITVDQDFKRIVKLGCDQAEASANSIVLIDKTVSLAGALSSQTENNIFSLDQGDELIINSAILNKKGSANISVTDYKSGREIYKRQEFHSLTDERVKIPYKSVYRIILYTDALFGKDASLLVKRIPAQGSKTNFSTGIKRVYDTTHVEVMNTKARVFSSTNMSHSNRTTLTLSLPQNTAYFVYWIGVDQSENIIREFSANLSPAMRAISSNPLVLFGLKLIPSLPMFNSAAVIDYQFMDTKNAIAFLNKQAYSYYRFKVANNISTDYSIIRQNPRELVLGMVNNNMIDGRDVYVRVVAFVIKERIVVDE